MCGIAGLFDPGAAVDHGVVREMQRRMIHRGPDGEGFFAREGLAMAMRRLAIIDRAGGDQPLQNEDRSVSVVYNGEIYNHHELRRELEAKGHVFRTKTDTEVIVHLYEEEGPGCVRRFDGMFAFSLWDERERRLLIARDRFGVKPLYIARKEGRLAWSSEINSLLADSSIPTELDWEAMAVYLALYYIPSPRTIYSSVRALRPAHYISVTRDGIEETRYWTPRFGGGPGDDATACGEIRRHLEEAVVMTMESEVPLGVFLSGGLDSTAIAGFAKRALEKTGGPLRTYSLGFDKDRSYDERPLARMVAHMYGTEHREFSLAPQEVPEILGKLVDVYGQPFGDWSAVVNYKLAQEAKATSTVILRGDGGDELFGGYPTLIASGYAEQYLKIPSFLRGGIRSMVENLPASEGYMALDFKMKRFVAGVRRPVEAAHLAWKEIFSDERRRAACPALAPFSGNILQELAAPLVEETAAGSADLLHRLMFIDLRVFLEGCGLITSDHIAMAHTVETRVPFLTNKLADFAFSLPSSMKIRKMKTKYIFRAAMESILPSAVLQAPKRGFVLPGAAWLRGPMKRMALETIAETPDFLNRRFTRTVLESHLSGRRDATRELSALINLILWSRSRK